MSICSFPASLSGTVSFNGPRETLFEARKDYEEALDWIEEEMWV